jgi:hypothetical protein
MTARQCWRHRELATLREALRVKRGGPPGRTAGEGAQWPAELPVENAELRLARGGTCDQDAARRQRAVDHAAAVSVFQRFGELRRMRSRR